MASGRLVRCPENEDLALYLWNKRREMAEPNGLAENLDMTISNAYRNICSSKTPIKTLKDLSKIKGVGKWIIRLMQGFFPNSPPPNVDEASPAKNGARNGKKAKGPKRYVPQKNSVAYALLITLYRAIANGSDFMKKQELIDAAEASGLSRTAIAPDKSKGKPGEYKSSARDWYTGWSCMKTLLTKGLVAKSSNPAKYMLTQEGQEAARECLLRSGLSDSTGQVTALCRSNNPLDEQSASKIDSTTREAAFPTISISCEEELNDYATKNFGGDELDSYNSDSSEFLGDGLPATATLNDCSYINMDCGTSSCSVEAVHSRTVSSTNPAQISCGLRPCTSFDLHVAEQDTMVLAMPPRSCGKFEELYDVILILDDRENFGSRSRKVVDNIQTQFKVLVEVRRLPVGDGIWIVRHRQSGKEYVLDFIVERKKVDDLWSSIRDNRYRDQKMRLQQCGLRKLIYLVEGDLNGFEAAESIKTACFTTEILEGFDVQRTTGIADTVRKYGYLTKSISQYYSTHFSSGKAGTTGVCPSFCDFIKKCQDLEKMTVSDVFALQLMQVPQVTEDVALAVTALYPTLLSMARAYSQLEGDVRAQEEMLKNQCGMINAGASRNIYKLVWGS
ncbi:crossover junction endonuclease MUS81 isoform X1 [Iris pallida]|uniref:Crossover junction endonuclease MUS81 n=1 Tax=Iris pallida TaxID=29817 RepID=A0AAX6I4H2_IRIPA|nr:crossover junction endonuclease MUS81 isoform X1 [Iris pallida]